MTEPCKADDRVDTPGTRRGPFRALAEFFRYRPTLPAEEISYAERKDGMRKVTLSWCFGAVFFSAMTGPALVGMFRQLGASRFTIALLGAIPSLIMGTQPIASYVVRHVTARKRMFLWLAYPGRLVWMPIALVGWLFPGHAFTIPLMLALVVGYRLSQDLSSPAWISWIPDLVPANERGWFWGSRQSWGTLTNVVVASSLGWYLGTDPPFEKFVIYFSLIAIMGWFDIFLHRGVTGIAAQPMPPPAERPGFLEVLSRPLRDPTFRPFTIWAICYMFTAQLGGAMFQILLLEEVKLSYFQISLFQSGLFGATIIVTSRLWGRIIDNVFEGERFIACLSAVVVGSTAIMWTLVPAQAYLPIAAIFVIAGIAQSGYQISTLNIAYFYAPAEDRPSYTAVHWGLAGLGGVAGALTSGAVVEALTGLSATWGPFIFTPARTVHLVAGTLQILTIILLLRVRRTNSPPISAYVRRIGELNPFERATWTYVRGKLSQSGNGTAAARRPVR